MSISRCKLRRKHQCKLLEFFVVEVTARSAANIMGLQANTVALFYRKIRQLIINNMADIVHERGQFEADESYFGGVRKGKRGRGASGKVPVFGILKRGGKVYTQMVPDTKSETLLTTLKTKILPDSVVYTDSYRSYDILDVSNFKHYRINHSQVFTDKQNHINGIENFWNQAKRTLRKYNGIPRKHFHLFLKECEFRFNYGSPKQQLATLKRWTNLS